MSITKSHETKIIRTTYEVGVFAGATAESIRRDLTAVPDNAKMIESWEDDRGGIAMKFEIERDQP